MTYHNGDMYFTIPHLTRDTVIYHMAYHSGEAHIRTPNVSTVETHAIPK